MKPSHSRTSALLLATLALSLSLPFTAPAWALDVQQAITQQQLEPLYAWVQSASLAELRNAYVSWQQLISTDVYNAETGIWKMNDYFGGSLLHWAAHTGQNQLIALLLDKGLEPDLQVFDTGTPLMAAARSGQLESVRLLVARGAEPDQGAGPDAISPLRMAIQEGHVEVARWLAAQKPLQPVCEQAQGLFADSVMGERLEMVRYLQEQGCGLQDRSQDGYTPLMQAARRGHVPLFQMLLAQGHDPRIQAPDRMTALMLAAQSGQAEIVDALLRAGLAVDATHEEGEDALQFALAHGHLPIVQMLLGRGASLKAKTPEGEGYLLAALHSGDLAMLRFVFSQGFAPTDLSAAQYQEVVSHAAYAGHTELLTYLLAQGVSPDLGDTEGMTPLLWAARMGRPQAVKLLLAAGVDPNGFGGQDALTLSEGSDNLENPQTGGYTPLMEAAVSGHPDIVEILLAAGADPLLKGTYGDTALSLACHDSSTPDAVALQIVQQLLAQGAQPDPVNDAGKSPLMYAAKDGHLEIVKLLAAKGASLHRRDAEGKTVLSHALSRNNPSVVSFLLDGGARVAELLPEHQLALLQLFADQGDLTRVQDLLEQLPGLRQQPDALFEIAADFAQKGHQEGVAFLLKRGVSAHARNEQNTSLLSRAAASGSLDLVKGLLSQGAWRRASEDAREQAVLSAAKYGQAEVLALLLAQSPAHMRQRQALALSQAAFSGQTGLVKLLLEQGAEPDFAKLAPALDPFSPPLLMAVEGGHVAVTKQLLARKPSADLLVLALKKASESGHLPLVQLLLDQGASLDREVDGLPFAFWLIDNGRLSVVKHILAQRPDWRPVLPDGNNLLLQAAYLDRLEISAYLIEQGFDPNARNLKGETPLMLTDSPDLMHVLVEKGAQVNLGKADGATALMRAAANTRVESVKTLLELGAEVNARKQDGTTALIWAVRRRDPFAETPHSDASLIYDLVEVLLEHGADPGLRDKAGKTALDYARSNRLPEVVALLTRHRR
ncbi:MAG: ankyrin repeat domain-containing protein [Candidatus Sericytochromatia bacterium]